MKKYVLYIGIFLIGLFLGWLFFGNLSNHHSEVTDKNRVWTCSMDPQVKQHQPGDCPICGMDLIPLEINADGLSPDQFRMTKNAVALANIQTTVVGGEKSATNNLLSFSGKIAVNEETNAVQVSYFDGRIERLHINHEGQQVKKGQLLAKIYAPELVAAQQELLTAVSLKESQPLLYNAVRNKLKSWKLSENQINAIEKRGEVRENFPIYTTVSGTVAEVMSTEGDYVKKGQAIAKVSKLNTVWAMFDAYENQLPLVQKGQKISIVTNAYPDKIFEATVSFIDPILNTKTRTVSIRAVLDNSKNVLKPGMFVSGTIKTNQNTNAESSIMVPSTAIMWTGKRSLVYIKIASDTPVFEMREVQLGTRNGEEITILSGLQSGEEIVTHGTFTVDAAAQLQGKKSMMNTGEANMMTDE